jgi:Flp pilus assembly protein TadB
VRQYRLRPRRAQVGTNAFAVLYAAPTGSSRTLARQPRPAPVRPAQTQRVTRSRSRARTVARRRRVLTLLFAALVIPALVALVTGSSAAWWVVVALLPLVCAYLFVLFRTRRIMAEREINLAFGAGDRDDTNLEDIFSGRLAHRGGELKAAGAGRY